MGKGLRPVTKAVAEKFEYGAMGEHRKASRAARASIKVRPKPKMPLNPSMFDRLRYSYQNWMHIFETNDKKFRQGELSFLFSIKWLWMYVFFALSINALYGANKWQEKRRYDKIMPELDERRKEYDPFDEEGQQNIAAAGTGSLEELGVNRAAADLRVDSAFVDAPLPTAATPTTSTTGGSWLTRAFSK
eukprot:TRINITY_DN3749_c1_g4_i1.p1 TRINITY_DN3749_c1_g4~~TRINITY_DN3749_c1_g4_i1.p1  ORF type:complete len:189 (+),score=56.58 TRINITY_DN3749_c1_g4_i1:72-638(+)